MLPEDLAQHAIAAAVAGHLPEAVEGGKLDRGELTLIVARTQIVCGFLKRSGFSRLSTVTAVDWFPTEPRFEVVYHLHAPASNERLRLKSRVPGADPAIDSVTGVWRAANWYEREVFDLFGVRFLNHPGLRRIMMPEEFEGNPLRKDFPVTGSRV
jgi:NADH-quinone oxidoreductase subunit C